MENIEKEVEEYLLVCENSKGLSKLTIKAYRIDLKQFCDFMQNKNSLNKEKLIEYINYIHKNYKPKSAKRKIASIKAFYNYLEEEEYYQLHLNQNGYHSSHDDLEGKTFVVKNAVAKQFKEYVEKKLQNENPIVTICVFNDGDFFVVVKPIIVDIRTLLKMD